MAMLTRMGRPTDLQDTIVQGLRGRIVEGNLLPGSRLPTRPELQDEFGASTNTVQRALERLKRDGFIFTDGRNGTFVSEVPPHLSRYGLVFPHSPQDRAWSYFWTALEHEAGNLSRVNELSIPVFHGLESHAADEEIAEFWRQVNGHLLAGLIMPAPLKSLAQTPLWREPGIPRVIIGSDKADESVPGIALERDEWSRKAREYLMARGRKRPAFLWYLDGPGRIQTEERLWQDSGFEIRQEWSQMAQPNVAFGAQRIVQLVMKGSSRPDSLVIFDDNLVTSAVKGLVEAGLRVPEDVEVLAHTNFPALPPADLPVTRLGYDCHELMQICIDLIDRQRRGLTVPPMTNLVPRFESELPNRR